MYLNSQEYKKLCYEANNKKLRLTKKLQEEIKRIYSKIYLKGSKSVSNSINDKLVEKHIKTILELLTTDIFDIQERIEDVMTEYLNEIAITANEPQVQMLFNLDKVYKLGLIVYFNKIFDKVPAKAMKKVLAGALYIDKLSMKRRIKRALKKNAKDLKYITTIALKQGKNYDQILKDLQIYLRVGKQKPLEWINLYPKASTQIDYNIQRIAKTYASHVFQETQKESCRRNPFVAGIKWLVSNSHRVCPLCKTRDQAVYKIDELPTDHPNGMCTTIPVLEKELDLIGEELGRWVKGEANSKLDNWYNKYK